MQQGEEMTIHYGKVWFDDTTDQGATQKSCMHEHMDDEDTFLAALEV